MNRTLALPSRCRRAPTVICHRNRDEPARHLAGRLFVPTFRRASRACPLRAGLPTCRPPTLRRRGVLETTSPVPGAGRAVGSSLQRRSALSVKVGATGPGGLRRGRAAPAPRRSVARAASVAVASTRKPLPSPGPRNGFPNPVGSPHRERVRGLTVRARPWSSERRGEGGRGRTAEALGLGSGLELDRS